MFLRRFWIFWVVLTILFSSPAWAATNAASVAKPLSIQITGLPKKHVPFILARLFHRKLNHIYTFDNQPLGDRIPVILLPGRAEEYQFGVWWKKFRNISHHNGFFSHHYKLYIFLYDSRKPLGAETTDFIAEMHTHFSHLPLDRQVVLVSYSLGGLIAAKAMLEDAMVFNEVNMLFAIAVPFHGSPLFTRKWYLKNLHPQNNSPIRWVWDRLIYRSYMFDKDNLVRGLKWDNFDDSQPQFGPNTVYKPLLREPSVLDVEDIHALKSKLVIYTGYVNNEYTDPPKPRNPLALPSMVDGAASLPSTLVSTVFPSYVFSAHSVLHFTNREIANLPSFSSEHPHGEKIHLYRYNDGAIPLSSSLFLPHRATPYDGDLESLVGAIDIQHVRLFPNTDHLDFGELHRDFHQFLVPDLLHPHDGRRTPINWVMYYLKVLYPKIETE